MIAMVDSLNCIQDDFITTDNLGESQRYVSVYPILLANNYYRIEIYRYDGRFLDNCHVSGRNSDSEPWEIIFRLADKREGSFISPKDYCQVRFTWNKRQPETNTRISYWIRPESVNHRNAYVSVNGDDSNPGTVAYPYKTIAKALSMKPKNVYLRKGDTFYESLTLNGVNLKSYGEGTKPTLSGLKILPASAIERGIINSQGEWAVSENGIVWRINLAMVASMYDGFKTSKSPLNNIGTLVNLSNGLSLNCRRVENVETLNTLNMNWLIWQPTSTPTSSTPSSNFDYLYVRYKGDLCQYSLGATVGTTGLNAQNCLVEGIKVAYWGRHGIQAGSNLTVSDCEIDCIGGMIQIGYPSWVCLGNGIEFYVTDHIHDALVENCEVSHCYDAGLTIQGSSENKLMATNVIFRNNTIRNCCQSFEEFLRGGTDDSVFVSCSFEFNKSYKAGRATGFRYDGSRYKKCHVLSNSNKRNTGMIYRHNVFDRGNFRCSGPYIVSGKPQYNQGIWEDNICRIELGFDLIGDYIGKNDVIKIPFNKGSFPTLDEAVNDAIKKYRQLTDDTETKFEIINNLITD